LEWVDFWKVSLLMNEIVGGFLGDGRMVLFLGVLVLLMLAHVHYFKIDCWIFG
jgi:hypothetical protein